MSKFAIPLRRILFVLIAILFAFIPLYPKFPLANVSGTFVAIRLEDLLIAVTIGVWVLYMFVSKGMRSFFDSTLNKAIILFFLVGVISIFSAVFLTHTVVLNLSIFHYLRRIEFILLLPAVFYAINSKRQIITILILLSVVLTGVNVYGLGQYYLDWPVISTTNSEFSKGLILRLTPGARVNSTFAGHYDLAVFLAMALVLLCSIFFAVKKRIKILIVLLTALSLIILIMTAARQSFVAAIIGTFLLLWITGKKKYIFAFFVLISLILVYPSQLRDRLVSTVTVNIFHQGERYIPQNYDQKVRSRLNIPTLAFKTSSDSAAASSFASPSGKTATDITPGEPVDATQLGVFRSFAIRLNLEWPRAINAFWKNPFLGTGYSSLGIATDNDFLRSMGETGLIGTWAFILLLVEIAKRIYRKVKSADKFVKFFSVGVFCMLITFILNGLFIDVFEASKAASLFWMMMGLGLSVAKQGETSV